jgi:hypothetical protein
VRGDVTQALLGSCVGVVSVHSINRMSRVPIVVVGIVTFPPLHQDSRFLALKDRAPGESTEMTEVHSATVQEGEEQIMKKVRP